MSILYPIFKISILIHILLRITISTELMFNKHRLNEIHIPISWTEHSKKLVTWFTPHISKQCCFDVLNDINKLQIINNITVPESRYHLLSEFPGLDNTFNVNKFYNQFTSPLLEIGNQHSSKSIISSKTILIQVERTIFRSSFLDFLSLITCPIWSLYDLTDKINEKGQKYVYTASALNNQINRLTRGNIRDAVNNRHFIDKTILIFLILNLQLELLDGFFLNEVIMCTFNKSLYDRKMIAFVAGKRKINIRKTEDANIFSLPYDKVGFEILFIQPLFRSSPSLNFFDGLINEDGNEVLGKILKDFDMKNQPKN